MATWQFLRLWIWAWKTPINSMDEAYKHAFCPAGIARRYLLHVLNVHSNVYKRVKIWSLYIRIKQNIYCNADLFIHPSLSQLQKQCKIEMTCTFHPSQKRVHKPSITKNSEKLMWHTYNAHLAQMWRSQIKTINWGKNANNWITWKVLFIFFPHLFKSFQNMPLNPRN